MFRRTGIILFLIFGLWAAWVYTKDVTFYRGADVDYRAGTVERVYVSCGEVVPILFQGEYNEDVSQYLHGQCLKAARSHFGWLVLLGGAAIGFLVTGLVRGKGPGWVEMDTALKPLPTVAELSHQKTSADR